MSLGKVPKLAPKALAGTTAGAIWCYFNDCLNKQYSEVEEPDSESDSCPTSTTDPGKFEPVRGTSGKINKDTGEVFEKDRLHKDHWEVYKNRRDYEKGRRDRDVWDDGRPKRKF